MKTKILTALLASALAGCGGSGSGSNDDSTPPEASAEQQTGTFIDSAVANIKYRTSTQPERARTNADGEFKFIEGDEVTFSVGGIDLPPTTAQSVVTPLDLAGTSDINDTAALNIARMLQTLDDDGNPDNGINILDQAHEAAAGISSASVDFTSETFGDDESLVNFFANSGSSTTELISTEQAKAHLSKTLASLSGPFTPEMLVGKSFYNVFADEADTHNWSIDAFSFDESGNGVTLNGKEGTYNVDNGVLVVTLTDETLYINVIGQVEDGHRKVCWAGELSNINQCKSLSVEHFFNSETAAQQFATLQNQGTINLEGTWRVTESYDICGDTPTVHYQTSTFELVSGGLSFTHDYVEDIEIAEACSVINNTTETESGVDEAFQDADNLNITSVELEALFGHENFHGIVFYNNDTFDIFEEFTAGEDIVVVTQVWTRQP